jgi:hypothetical protein
MVHPPRSRPGRRGKGGLALEPLAAGDPEVVAGYRLRGRLGAGGMGRVFLALTPGGRPVAMKMVRQELADDPDFRVRFRQEIAAARRVHGLFTAQVLDADPAGSPPWLVTAYVPGPSLAQAVADHGPLPPESVFLLVAGVAEALGAIHQAGVIHRDLKPSNVLLAGDGPRVIDFGIARAAEATSLTRTGMRVGSPGYMAPEQVRDGEVTPAADIFALGALAAFAATGRPPFGLGREEPVLYRVLHEEPDLAGLPEGLRSLLAQCLAKDPSVRPSPTALIEACADQSAGKTVEFTEAWLPPAVVADLGQHAAGLADAGLAVAGLAAGLGAAPAAGDPTRTARTAAQAPPESGGEPAPVPRRWPRSALIAVTAAAVLFAGLIGWGVLAVVSSGAQGSRHPTAGGSAAGPDSRRNASSKALARASPVPSPSPSSGLDACLFGTWDETTEDEPGTINSQSVMWVGGPGIKQVFEPNGINLIEYASNAKFTASEGGNSWTEIFHGARARMHYVTQDGQLLNSDIVTHGTSETLENGGYNNSTPVTLDTEPDRYTCSATTLQFFAPNGSSIVMSREIPKTPSGS